MAGRIPDVRALRLKMGYCQWAFSKLMNKSEKTIWNWEHGRSKPDPVLVEFLRYLVRRLEWKTEQTYH